MIFLFLGAMTASWISTIVSPQLAIGYAVFLFGMDFLILQHYREQTSFAKLAIMAGCLNIGLFSLAVVYSFLGVNPGLLVDFKEIFTGVNRLLPDFFNERLMIAIAADTGFKTVLASIFLRRQLSLSLFITLALSFFTVIGLPILVLHIMRNYFDIQI
jgi:hypothetical protein